MRMRCRAEAAEQRTMECSEKLRAEIAQLQGELSRRAHTHLRTCMYSTARSNYINTLERALHIHRWLLEYKGLERCTRGTKQHKDKPTALAINQSMQEPRLVPHDLPYKWSGSAARHGNGNVTRSQDAGAAGRGPHSQPYVCHTAAAAWLAGAGQWTACRGPLVWCAAVSVALCCTTDSE